MEMEKCGTIKMTPKQAERLKKKIADIKRALAAENVNMVIMTIAAGYVICLVDASLNIVSLLVNANSKLRVTLALPMANNNLAAFSSVSTCSL